MFKKENLKMDFLLACFRAVRLYMSILQNVRVLHFIHSSSFKMIENPFYF